jgi:pyrimidine-nucleoside phosphorylase
MITDMDAPLGTSVGNSLEIVECIETLKGNGVRDLVDVVTALAARMVVLAGVEAEAGAARTRVESALSSGRALDTLRRMIAAHGGNPRVVDDYSLLPSAPGRAPFKAPRAGFVSRMAAGSIGRAAHALGAGRATVGDAVDHGVGVIVLARPGDRVREGQPLVELRHRDDRGVPQALAFCAQAVAIADDPPASRPKVLGEVR